MMPIQMDGGEGQEEILKAERVLQNITVRCKLICELRLLT